MNREKAVFAGVIIAAAVLRLGCLLIWGPIYQGDSTHFIGYAGILSENLDWLSDAALDEGSRSKTTFRMIGFPLLLAALKGLFADGFDEALVVLQSAVSLIATGLIFYLARALALTLYASAFAALAHTSSILLLFDLNVLPDSLFANGLIIPLAMLALGALSRKAPSAAALLAAGIILALTLLIRETTLYFLPFWGGTALIWAKLAGGSWRRAAACFLLIIAPALILTIGYREWNRYRTGEAFLTTGAQMTMWFGPVQVAAKVGADAFAEDPLIMRSLQLAAETDPEIPMAGAKAINRYLFENEGLQAPQIARLAFRAYFQSIRIDAWEFLKGRLDRYKPRSVIINLSRSFETIIEMSENRRIPGFTEKLRMARTGAAGPDLYFELAVDVLQRVVSVVVLLAFVVGVPTIAVRHLVRRAGALPADIQILSWFWICYFALNGAYLLASFEERYVIAGMPFACMGGLWVLGRMFPRVNLREVPRVATA